MTSKLRFIAQEHPDTCAVACLRMLLAARGPDVSEAELVQAAGMQVGGLSPDELKHLAKQYGLTAEAQQLDLVEIVELVAEELFPIVFLYRRPLDRVAAIHAVIPWRVSPYFVTALDPLRGERRVSRWRFEEARRWVDRWCVVYEPA